jgi:alpha-beta hydrolase superfamily lysophospholipase
VRSRRPAHDAPTELAEAGGLAYALYLPAEKPSGSVLILHGAGSCKESHFDFARAARAMGFAALALDLPGHGDSRGPLTGAVLDDLRLAAALLPAGRLALRGSSMGGYLALIAAGPLDAAAVVAICPAGSEHLLRGLRTGTLHFDAGRESLEPFLAAHDPLEAVASLRAPLLLLHAEGDEQIPYEHSVALHEAAGCDPKRLIVVPGGHHRSVQHDPELQAQALRFLRRALASAQ